MKTQYNKLLGSDLDLLKIELKKELDMMGPLLIPAGMVTNVD
jgi:hypothetical protein